MNDARRSMEPMGKEPWGIRGLELAAWPKFPRGVCRGCGGELPKRRRAWCSDGCNRAYFDFIWKRSPHVRTVLARDGFRCCRCGLEPRVQHTWERWRVLREDGGTKATLWLPDLGQLHCDHIQPLSRGGSHSWDNLQCLCVTCNLRKGSKTEDEFNARLTQLELAL